MVALLLHSMMLKLSEIRVSKATFTYFKSSKMSFFRLKAETSTSEFPKELQISSRKFMFLVKKNSLNRTSFWNINQKLLFYKTFCYHLFSSFKLCYETGQNMLKLPHWFLSFQSSLVMSYWACLLSSLVLFCLVKHEAQKVFWIDIEYIL